MESETHEFELFKELNSDMKRFRCKKCGGFTMTMGKDPRPRTPVYVGEDKFTTYKTCGEVFALEVHSS